jgi:hypothetical protein
MQQDKYQELESLARPLMKYLAENHHPHTTIILNQNSCELVESLTKYLTDEFLVD